MRTSQKGIDLIKSFEGLRLTAYKPVKTEKYWTIGYGHYGVDVKQGQKITEPQAEELLKKDLQKFEQGVNNLFTAYSRCPFSTESCDKASFLNQNQFDALVSFAFNLGLANLQSSTLLKKIRTNPKDETIKQEFLRWVNAGGKRMEGLVKRRRAESDLYFSTL